MGLRVNRAQAQRELLQRRNAALLGALAPGLQLLQQRAQPREHVRQPRGVEVAEGIELLEVLQLAFGKRTLVLVVVEVDRQHTAIGLRFGDRQAFGKLLRAAGRIEGLERIRFTSPHPAAFTDDVIDAIEELADRLRIEEQRRIGFPWSAEMVERSRKYAENKAKAKANLHASGVDHKEGDSLIVPVPDKDFTVPNKQRVFYRVVGGRLTRTQCMGDPDPGNLPRRDPGVDAPVKEPPVMPTPMALAPSALLH